MAAALEDGGCVVLLDVGSKSREVKSQVDIYTPDFASPGIPNGHRIAVNSVPASS